MKGKKMVWKLFWLVLVGTLLQTLAYGQSGSNNNERTATVRVVPDSVAEQMKRQREFLYANDSAYWQQPKTQDDSALVNLIEKIAGSPLLKWFLYMFLAFVIIFAIYQVMVVNDFFVFSKPKQLRKGEQEEEEEYSPENIDEKISEAIAAGHYRQAVRFMYLKTLHVLNDKKMVQLHAKSTNHDYILQMEQHQQGKEFRKLTRIYEFVWYGGFQPSANQFEFIRNNFSSFIGNT